MIHHFKIKLRVLILLLFTASLVYGQPNKRIDLLHFSMPDNVGLNGSFTVNGYIKNTGNGTIKEGTVIHGMIETSVVPENTSIETGGVNVNYLPQMTLGKLHAGDSVYIEHIIQVDPGLFSPGVSSIVIIWPTSQIIDIEDSIRFEQSIYVNTNPGNTSLTIGDSDNITVIDNNRRGAEPVLAEELIQFNLPNPKVFTTFTAKFYDVNGQLVAKRTITCNQKAELKIGTDMLVSGQKYSLILVDENRQKILLKKKIIKR